MNVVKFLETGKLNIALANLKFGTGTIDVDVNLTHPFPGLDSYTGFDVRGIFITPGTISGYTDAGIIHADQSSTFLMNADGWTRWWNPSEFPVGDTISGYRNGKLGNPYDGSNLNATLNGYKYFCDDLKVGDDLSVLNPLHRGMFQSGYTNGRHYQIHFDSTKPLVFNYAVDASWEPSVPSSADSGAGRFSAVGECSGAIQNLHVDRGEHYFYKDASNKGGHAVVNVNVYDWYGCQWDKVSLESPGIWTVGPSSASGGNASYSTWQFDLSGNQLGSSNSLLALLSGTATDATYGLGTVSTKNVATCELLSIPISSTANAPTVIGIDPNHYEIKKTLVGAKVTGTSFASNATVSLILDGATTPVIQAVNVVESGGNSITCDIPLTDVSVVPGKYDVRVTNPDTGLYGELDKGFTVDDVNPPWPGWMAGGLNEAASKFVGYGSSGAPTAPKWTYSNTSYGGPAAGCAIGKDGTIYVCAYNAALIAVNPNGTQKWVFTKPSACWISISPAIDKNGYIYVCIGTSSINYLYKIDPSTHIETWACNLGSAPCYPGAPAIGLDGAVYVYTGSILDNSKLMRVNPDGSAGWSVSLSNFADSYTWQMGTAVLPSGDIVCSADRPGRYFVSIRMEQRSGNINIRRGPSKPHRWARKEIFILRPGRAGRMARRLSSLIPEATGNGNIRPGFICGHRP